MKTLFLRLLPVFSIAFFAGSPCNRVNSCYYGPDFGDTNMAFFNPELGNDSIGLRPFYFTQSFLFDNSYGWMWGGTPDIVFSDYRQNCTEWQAYLGKNVAFKDVYEAMYDGNPDGFLTAMKTQTLTEYKPGNTFIKALQRPENAAAMAYFNFAKQVEFQQFESNEDPWAEDYNRYNWPSYNSDTLRLPRLADEAARQLGAAPDDFLSQRWAYQRINTLFYLGRDEDLDSIRQIFRENFEPRKDRSVVSAWALLKIAELNANTAEANFQLSQVFDRCESKRFRVVQLYQRGLEEKSIAYAQTRRERAAVLTLSAMRDPGRALASLRRVAEIAPESPYFPLLLSREINKLENWLLTPRFAGGSGWYSFMPDYDWDENFDRKVDRWRAKAAVRDREYLREVRAFVQAQARKQPSPLLTLALAHLQYMEGEYEQSWRTLQQLRAGNNELYTLQQKIQELLLLPHRADVRKPAVQQALYERLLYVRSHHRLLAEPARQIARIHQALCFAFWERGDVPRAGLLFGRGSNYVYVESNHMWTNQGIITFYDNLASRSDLEALDRLLHKPDKTPFEKYLTQRLQAEELDGIYSEWQEFNTATDSTITPSTDELYELMGMHAMREGDLAYARQAFAKVDTGYWSAIDGIWTVDITGSRNFIAADSLSAAGQGMNKYQIVDKMFRLEQEAAQNPAKRAENYYLLGNAWYHCSYWGKAGSMLTYYRSINDTDEPLRRRRSPAYLNSRPDPARYGAMFYRCARAARYFQKSLAYKPDSELAARTFYMLAECDRRSRWVDMRRKSEYGDGEGGVASPLFKTWAKRYKNTQAYKQCLEECPGLEEYLGK